MKSQFQINSRWVSWTTIVGVFGIVPTVVYWFAIRLPMQQIRSFEKNTPFATAQQWLPDRGVVQAALHEQAAVSRFQEAFLARVPVVKTSDDLVQYGAVLAGALTHDAIERGLQVIGLEMVNHLVKGQYIPEGSGASTSLAGWPRLSPTGTRNSLRVPMLDLPSLELQMKVRGQPSSKVFTFVEALANYPVLINVTRIDLEKNSEDVSFRLKMRSYYWSPEAGQEHE
ncbi:MAG TPA: hypothetical protein VMW38_15005 [Terriglobia bacterium]|nr:hypothetical protein [Terriglobia bacterium]